MGKILKLGYKVGRNSLEIQNKQTRSIVTQHTHTHKILRRTVYIWYTEKTEMKEHIYNHYVQIIGEKELCVSVFLSVFLLLFLLLLLCCCCYCCLYVYSITQSKLMLTSILLSILFPIKVLILRFSVSLLLLLLYLFARARPLSLFLSLL